MSITLKFFMIKRGLTVEKMANKSNSRTPEDLISYARSLNIGVTKADEALILNYFESLQAEVKVEPPTLEQVVVDAPLPVHPPPARGKKKAGKNV